MKRKLLKILLLTSCVWLWGTISAAATVVPKQEVQRKSVASVLRNSRSIREIRQLSEMERPSTSAQQLLVQSPTPQSTPTPTIQITGVKANSTEKGVEIILETPLGSQLQVTNRSTGNNFIADVSGGQLRLPSGEAFTFRSEKTLAEIAEITVTNVDANTVRVMVVGVAAMPTVELFDDNAGLVFGIASQATAISPPQQPQTPASETPQEEPAAQQDEPIELVVTGEQDGYNVQNATTATRTDTPLRDIPQSIQVVPRQVLEDRNVRTLNESVETVSGVSNSGDLNGATGGGRSIRGFFAGENLRNGFSQGDSSFDNVLEAVGTIEQVEVLKGPASVLFGALEPGGIINVVTKQPLSEPYYKLEFEAGNYGFYQPLIDFSGPLSADKTVLYRFIASYQGANGFQDFVNTQLTTVAPSITLNLGDRTSLNLYYEYTHFFANPPRSFVPLLSDGSLPPKSFYATYPDLYFNDITTQKFDQNVTNINEALRNVPGVSQGNLSASRTLNTRFNIRGFNAQLDTLRNGLKDPTLTASGINLANIEQIEVLKGPASVLYGQGSLGGVVNYVTKQPLSKPYYSLEASAGSFNFYRGALDFSGPLNDSKTVLYRLNLAALTTKSFVDFYDEQQYFVAPVVTWQISDRTKLTLEAEYFYRPKQFGQSGVPAEGSILPNPNGKIPRNFSVSGPDNIDNNYNFRVGYNLEHRFSENWQIRNAFSYTRNASERRAIGYRTHLTSFTVLK